MAEASIWDSFLQKAFHLDSQYHGRHDVFLLAKYVVESGEIEHNGSHVPLPEFCSASETRVCHLVKLLPTLNELLYYLGAEVTEVAPGRIAVRCYRSIYLELTIGSGFRMVKAVMILYCIVANHRCIDILEVTLQPRQQYDISPLMSCVLQRMSSLRSFALKGSELTDDATTIAFKAIARLLQSQLAELSLECLDLAKPSQKACASLDAFATALSASRKLKRLKLVEVLIENEVSAEMFDFVGKVAHALTNNTSIRLWIFAYFSTATELASIQDILRNPDRRQRLSLLFAPLGHKCGATLCADHISSLHISGNNSVELPLHLAQEFGVYLASTCSLRQLRMLFEAPPDQARCILEGIAKNTSIQQLQIERFFVKNSDWALLTNWLTNNRRVYSFEVPPPAIGHEALVDPLVECLQDNYCVTTVKIDDVFLGQTPWTKVKQMAQRNYGLLQCAAAFALGSSHKRAAVAYERVSWHPQLRNTIKSMGNLSTGEAMERIQQSNRRLRDQAHFWQLCGIVQGRIVCHEAPAAANGASVRQLDNVGEDVLQLIRSYLKVGDILDDEEELPETENSLASNERYYKRKRSDSPQE
ncbi:uncharacterized protein LOC119169832 [Rhipicephalus microplus]|uniref:uncharacterized protein LOC119169832 n=1 Tax=Rhipicephalus microplus TaxID=6941 RepID=UPI003F6B0816